MPRGKIRKYDYELILKTYDELGDLKAVSEKLGVEWRSVYNVVKKRNLLPFTVTTVPPQMVDKILKKYAETNNIRDTAVMLNVTRHLVHTLIRRHVSNICNRCKAQIKVGEKYCNACRRHFADRIKANRAEKRRLGLCYECDKPVEPPSRNFCRDHRIARYDFIKKLPKANRGSKDQVNKVYGMLKTYGEAAVKLYEESDHRCAICGRQQGDVQIHIHHVNCDEKDHRIENLICLCFAHHAAVHSILRAGSSNKLIEWMKVAYANHAAFAKGPPF